MRELALNILDIVMNAVEAGASRIIVAIDERASANRLCVRIRDNGRGMSEEMVQRVLDPFVTTRTTRSVGMGLSMFRQIARQCGGDLTIQSQLGRGTLVTTMFQLDSLNRPPIGDMAESLVNLILGSLDVHFYYAHHTDDGAFGFDSFWLFSRMAEQDCQILALAGPAKIYIKERLKSIASKAVSSN
ncbi:ATP-binding protein [candidate division KSB1 bacterium]|nr:ATP-binding protein [candidate division KSB1 bacterium]RQW02802.1 MAG: ATP-binding protein [candidate division KSB1 bacterium]